MSRDIELAKRLRNAENYTCVLVKGENVYCSRERGVKPLVEWISEGKELRGYAAADKVVGRAAAFLYAYMGISSLYADVLSECGQKVLRDYGITNACGVLVPQIINRAGTGLCPMEEATGKARSPLEALGAVRLKLEKMGIFVEKKKEEKA